MTVISLFLSFALSACVTACMIPRIILISFKKRLFDSVDARKVHHGPVPRLGGVAFVPALVFSCALVYGLSVLTGRPVGGLVNTVPLSLGLCALLLLYFEGVTDDLVGVGYKAKFFVQFLCAGLVAGSGVWLNDLQGLFGIHEIPWFVGQPLTVVLIVFVVNAVNLIDGIDGLASGLSMVALFFLGAQFAGRGDHVAACVSFAMLGALVPFFGFNVFGKAERHGKIFMGDCGSQVCGLVLAFLAVLYAMRRSDAPAGEGSAGLVTAFSVLLVPGLDVIRVMSGRIRRGNNPFLPDKTHIHHKFLALGMSHRTAMATILALDACLVFLNLGVAGHIDINIVLIGDIVLFALLQIWLSHLIRRKTGLSDGGSHA